MNVNLSLFTTRPFVFVYGVVVTVAAFTLYQRSSDEPRAEDHGSDKKKVAAVEKAAPKSDPPIESPIAGSDTAQSGASGSGAVDEEPAEEASESEDTTGNARKCDVYDIADCTSVTQTELFKSTVGAQELKAKCESGEYKDKNEYFCGWELELASVVTKGVFNTCKCECMKACDVPPPKS